MDIPVRRRDLLAGLGVTGSAALAGCAEQIWSRAESPSTEQITLEIKTVPADDDLIAAQLSNRLAENLRGAGIDVDQTAIDEAELHREVLIERDYDVFVVRYDGIEEPDTLRSLLHSDYVGEQGWQNPFSFSDPTGDEYLDDQRRQDGSERLGTLNDLFSYLVEEDTIPYTVAVFHEHIGAADARLDVSTVPYTPEEHLHTLYNPPDVESTDRPLQIGLFGQQLVSRLNPIVVDLTDVNTILDLVYDPLVRKDDDEYVPWLADDVEWDQDGNGAPLEATVTLREGLTWHDDESIDAEDIEFTAEFLSDTALGGAESPITAPRYRGRQSLIDDVVVVDSRTVRIPFENVSREVAQWAFTIPLLPKHIWKEQSELIDDQQTRALTWDNDEPVGSGLFAFDEADGDDTLELRLFEDHVLLDTLVDDVLDDSSLDGSSDSVSDEIDDTDEEDRFDGIEFRILPNAGAAIDDLIDGELDLIGNELPVDQLETIEEEDSIRLLTRDTGAFYMIGYNIRHAALGNRRFRGAVSRMIDREHTVSEFFEGYATPPETNSQFVGMYADEWEGDSRTHEYDFPGEEGEIDEERARELFEEAGYTYTDGELVE